MDKRGLKSKRFDYTKNHQLIENAMFEHIMKFMVLPTQAEIAKATGLNAKTIERHASDINIGNLMPEYKRLTPKVMRGLLIKAAKGDAPAAKLWLQLVEDHADKVDHNHGGKVDLSAITDKETQRKLYLLALSELDENENE